LQVYGFYRTLGVPGRPFQRNRQLPLLDVFLPFFYPNFNMNKIEQVSPKSEVLVGGLEHLLFFHILRIIIPTDELIFFTGAGPNHQPEIDFDWMIGLTRPKRLG
jgi:hypothetical protein